MKLTTRSFSLAAFLLLSTHLFAQDTIRVMQYNVLRYGATGIGGCTPTSVSTKNGYLSTIFTGAQPDIIGLNEMGPHTAYASNILANVLEPMDTAWTRTTYTNNASADITNHLFFKSTQFGLVKEQAILHSLRDANYYKLYYKDPGLAPGSDTTFLHIVIVHLDATGATSTTAVQQADGIMDYYNAIGKPDNYIVMGDMNADASTDTAMKVYYNHPNMDIRMYDPIAKPGTWHNNSGFEPYHTQSTRASTTTPDDCGSSGGMDDRFDHIMISKYIRDDSARVKYVPGSYWAYGNDGNHFNSSINSPANSSVSATIAGALFSCSDHLPVLLDLEFSLLPTSEEVKIARGEAPADVFIHGTPVGEETTISVSFSAQPHGNWTAALYDLRGKLVWNETWKPVQRRETLRFSTAHIASGVYFFKLTDEAGLSVAKKLIKR